MEMLNPFGGGLSWTSGGWDSSFIVKHYFLLVKHDSFDRS